MEQWPPTCGCTTKHLSSVAQAPNSRGVFQSGAHTATVHASRVHMSRTRSRRHTGAAPDKRPAKSGKAPKRLAQAPQFWSALLQGEHVKAMLFSGQCTSRKKSQYRCRHAARIHLHAAAGTLLYDGACVYPGCQATDHAAELPVQLSCCLGGHDKRTDMPAPARRMHGGRSVRIGTTGCAALRSDQVSCPLPG